MAKIKCPQCLKIVLETDNCDGCDKSFCGECLTYRGEKDSEGELAFCPKCEKE
jgi:hypothetical protein